MITVKTHIVKYSQIKHSLRGKIFLRFTLLVGLAIFATGTFSTIIARSTIRERTVQDLLTVSTRESQDIEQFVDAHRSLTRLLALDESVVQFFRIGRADVNTRANLIRKRNTVQSLENIVLLNKKGQAVLSTNSSLEGKDFSESSHFIRGKRGAYVGSLRILDSRRTYVISAPVYSKDGIFRGVLIGEYSMEELYRTLSGAKGLGDTGEFLLLEPKTSGGFCINPRLSAFSKYGALQVLSNGQTNEQGIAQRRMQGQPSLLCSLFAAGREGIITAEDADGNNVIAAHTQLLDIGLGLIVKVDEKEIFHPVRLLLTVLMGTTAILFLVVVFISIRLSQDVVRPILHLRKSLEKLNTGHWEHKRSIFTGDELEILDSEVKRLSERLKEAYSSLEKKVEERTRQLDEEHAKDEALLESIGEGFLAIDMNGKIVASNRSGEEMLHWEKEEIIGAHFSATLNLRTKDGKPVAPNNHFIQKAIDQKEKMCTALADMFFCERKDGSSFPISICASPFLIGMEMRGVVVTFRDITEEKKIDRMKSEFISLASHQLRTPLTAIGWYVELLQGEKASLSEEQQDYLAQIFDSHERMVDLVNSLLNVSRIELGRLKILPEKTTVTNLVDESTKELLPQIEHKHLSFEKRFPENLSISIDIQLVQMVLQNLLSNAVKYTNDGGRISLSILSDGQDLRFEIKDSGLGIPKEQQGRVFEKLFRADNVVKTDTEGTGIGLYIAKYTTEAWGGRLWFESTEGKGSAFYFTAPINMKKIEESGHDWEA